MKYISTLFVSALLTVALLYASALLLAPLPITAEYWVRQMVTVKLDIAKKYEHQRKVVFASGSYGLFSIDAALLGRELHLPVLNLGLHAGLPLGQILNIAGKTVERGDILILSLERPKYAQESAIYAWQARNMIAWQPELWKRLPLPQKVEAMTKLGPEIFVELFETRIDVAKHKPRIRERLAALDDALTLRKFDPHARLKRFRYSAFQLDAVGDMRMTDGNHYRGIDPQSPERLTPFSDYSLQLLRSFVDEMHSRGVRVYFANTPYVKDKAFDMARVRATSEQFRQRLAKFGALIDNKQDVIFDRKYFFNTPRHLNAEGRKMNTERLRKIIEPLLSES